MAEAMDNAKLVADAHKIARCVRGCATDAQYQELTANIEAALASANEMNERLVAELRAATGYLLNAKIDLETGAPKTTAIGTIDGGLKRLRAVLDEVAHG